MARRHETKGLARHHRESTAAGARRQTRHKLPSEPSTRLLPDRAFLTWEQIGHAIEVVIVQRQSVEVGACGPHYNNGRQQGEDFFASILGYAGSIERTRYGVSPRAALSKLFSEDS